MNTKGDLVKFQTHISFRLTLLNLRRCRSVREDALMALQLYAEKISDQLVWFIVCKQLDNLIGLWDENHPVKYGREGNPTSLFF